MTTEPTNPKPRRRWRQFSLRTLFVLLTVACVGLAWLGRKAYRAWEQNEAVEWVWEMGGSVSYDDEFDEDEVPSLVSVVQLLATPYFQEASDVDMHGRQVKDVTALAKLESLHNLSLDNTNVSNLTPLAELTSLERLSLNNTHVSDLTPLAELTSLQELSLRNTPVSEEQVKKLRQALPNCSIDWSPRPPDQSPSQPLLQLLDLYLRLKLDSAIAEEARLPPPSP